MRWRYAFFLPFLLLLIPLLDGLISWESGRRLAETEPAQAARLLERAARRLPFWPELWEQAGLLAYRAQETEYAIQWLEQARARQALTLEGWDTLGLAYWKEKQPERALARWQEAQQSAPSVRLLMRQALAYRQLQDWAKEQAALEQWIQRKADDAYAHYRLGLLLLAEDPPRATEELSLALSLEPRLEPAVVSLQAALQAMNRLPQESARHLLLGRALGAVEEWELALRLFERARQEDPQNGEAWAWIAEAYQHLGLPVQDELERAQHLAPDSATVYLLQGLYASRNGKSKRALEAFQRAAALQPQEAAIWIALGEAWAQQNDLQAALQAYQRATGLAPQDAATWRALANFSATYGIEIAELGLPAARRAVTLQPEDARNLDTLGWLLLLNGELEAAARTLHQALALQPDLASAHLHLGSLLLYQGHTQEAQTHLQEVIRLAPNSPLAAIASQMLGGR
ncbi:MAG: tetratricopeptide repeat protein [Chloroflexi bacterium]|jgi:tetratricopeptide (TPR) repeat protein|nr:tetratricopeptide repeat protein [Chloroflexota bacterium]